MANREAGEAPVFQVRIASTGEALEVPRHKSILHVLVENGYRVPSSCSDGRCGTCKVRYLSGEPDHRDSVLEPEERSQFLTVCVSRAKSEELVLDLPAAGAAIGPRDPFALDRPIAVVDAEICVACLNCVRACTFHAARIDPDLTGVGGIQGAAAIDMDECTGCGLCAAACPTGAIAMTKFTDGEVASQVDGLLTPSHSSTPHIIAFACPNALPAVRAYPGGERPSACDLEIVDMPCTGRVDNLHIMRAFEDGADGVVVAGCEPGCCLFNAGNTNAEKRVRWIRDWLDEVGLGSGRACMVHVPQDGADQFANAADAFAEEVRALGSSPLRAGGARSAATGSPAEARPVERG